MTFPPHRLKGRIAAALPSPARKLARDAARRVRAWKRGPRPRVFANSIPKAGTHLIVALLRELGYTIHENQPVNPDVRLDVAADAMRPVLARTLPGEYIVEHLPWDPEAHRILREAGFVALFVWRDPRAATVSFARYAAEMNPAHRLHAHFRALPDTDARVLAALEGVPDACSSNGRGRAPQAELHARFRGWVGAEGVCGASFEELVGPRGGGDPDAQIAAIRRILLALGEPDDPSLVRRIADRIYDPGAITFRKARIDGWRDEIRPETRARLEADLRDTALRWGYAGSDDRRD